MISQSTPVRPPRIASWLVELFAPGEHAGSILGDLLEEFSDLASKSDIVSARRWYWRQSATTVAHLIGPGFRIAPWSTTATVVGGVLLLWFGSGLPEQAIFAVLRRYRVFENHFNTYVFFATDGITIARIIASMFVGCIVALATKGREMVATMTLGLVLCAMTGAASLVLVARGHGLILWMLPWYFADWFAIIIGGVIVREFRLLPARRHSHT
jgi:hypothetical protein